jgi:hypothetical protein
MFDDEIAMVRRHIELGVQHIKRQHELIAQLASFGADTGLSEQVLANFEGSLALHREHLAHLEGNDINDDTG